MPRRKTDPPGRASRRASRTARAYQRPELSDLAAYEFSGLLLQEMTYDRTLERLSRLAERDGIGGSRL